MAIRSAVQGRRLRGIAITAASAVCFGTTPIFARAAYRSGADPVFALAVRFALASVILLLLVLVTARAGAPRLPRGRTLQTLALLGGLCYAGEALGYFLALQRAPATLVAVLLYLYPAMVVALSRLLHGVSISSTAGACLGVAVLGSALAVGPVTGAARAGGVLAVGAAAVYAVYIVLAAEPVRTAGPLPATAVVMSAAAVVLGVATAVLRPAGPGTLSGWLALGALAGVCTVAAAGLFLAGLSLLGPVDASTVSTLEPVVSAVLAATLLGDRLTPVQLFGAALVLAAIVALARTAGSGPALTATAARPARAR